VQVVIVEISPSDPYFGCKIWRNLVPFGMDRQPVILIVGSADCPAGHDELPDIRRSRRYAQFSLL